ncbi:DUF3017 domain-containing protein [Kineococcus gynurae]|uniref:DUF3017 domain-containing protein n=1 Tax=Kineococcus gynurae TaxID=452979 RepID=A0ABV5LTA0_9ACTN
MSAPPPPGLTRPPAHPATAVLLALLGGVALALLTTWVAGPTAGGLLLAADLAVAAVLRLVLPVRVAGALAVRSRGVDVTTLLVLAVLCAALASVLPLPPV